MQYHPCIPHEVMSVIISIAWSMNQKHIFLERVFFDFFLLFVSDKLGELTLGQCIYFLCMKTTLWSEHVPGIQNYNFS